MKYNSLNQNIYDTMNNVQRDLNLNCLLSILNYYSLSLRYWFAASLYHFMDGNKICFAHLQKEIFLSVLYLSVVSNMYCFFGMMLKQLVAPCSLIALHLIHLFGAILLWSLILRYFTMLVAHPGIPLGKLHCIFVAHVHYCMKAPARTTILTRVRANSRWINRQIKHRRGHTATSSGGAHVNYVNNCCVMSNLQKHSKQIIWRMFFFRLKWFQ